MIDTLIVEDDINYVLYTINNVLSKINRIRVTNIATTIAEATSVIKRENIDLILLDLNLPDATGVDFINKIKEINFIRKPTIIIISSELPLIKKVKY